VLGVLALGATLALPPPAEMPPAAWRVAGVALLMAAWWITEALPLAATALVPIILFPLLGIAPSARAAAPYADPVIFLFLGGFVIGTGMQRWNLHKRIGLHVIARTGTAPRGLVGGFLLATALLSMWISNSATAIMMLPVALSVLSLLGPGLADERSRRNLGVALMLAVAYGASIGGLGTLIGTPPNALLAAYMVREHGVSIGFAQWMVLGVPLVAVLLAATWQLLVRLHPVARADGGGDGAALVAGELAALGPVATAEWRVAAIFALTAGAWVTRPLYAGLVPTIDDTVIAVAGALALFILPSGTASGGRLLAWDDLKSMPWGVLILFGGGLSLAGAIGASGLAAWLGEVMGGLSAWPVLVVVAGATVMMIFLTEITSNTASAATFIPIGAAIAAGIGLDPLALVVPITLAASCAFMLPVATPPNAIVFASERLSVAEMARAGFLLNLLASAAIMALAYPLAGWMFGR